MAVFVSLFRAVNVGGNSKVKMAELKELHESLGFKNAAAYLQTGNVVFESEESDPAKIAGEIARGFEKKFGFPTPVIVREAAELKDLFSRNPFINQPDKEAKWTVVMFLEAAPPAGAQLPASYAGPEELVISGKELFIYYPQGIGESKLTNSFIEKKLKVTGTGRNWNTVTRLLELAQR